MRAPDSLHRIDWLFAVAGMAYREAALSLSMGRRFYRPCLGGMGVAARDAAAGILACTDLFRCRSFSPSSSFLVAKTEPPKQQFKARPCPLTTPPPKLYYLLLFPGQL